MEDETENPPKNAFSERGFEMLVCIHECPLYCKIERGNFPKRKTLLEHVNFKTTFHVPESFFSFSENYFSKIEEMVLE